MSKHSIPGQDAGDKIAGGSNSASASKDPWMKLAQDAFKRSTTYYENNFQRTVEDGLRLFNSQHPRDSKYHSEGFRFRSKIFRPKTRSVIRKHEATAALAFFSNPDVLSIDPVSQEDPANILSADITKELLQYRLTKSIPWFLTLIGAFQDAATVGICASFNYWDYRTEKQKQRRTAMFGGQQLTIEMEVDVPVVDKPCCELWPINHIRFDPGAKWNDVVNTSPYLILQMPMYLQDVLDRMEVPYGKGDETWRSLPQETILKARITDFDPVQQARDNKREDPDALKSSLNEFDIVMVHLNFIKNEGKTWVYYTLKDQELLSDPRELSEVFLHGQIPVTIGFCVIETHKSLPNGLAQLGSQLQQEANEIANQRLDNVKFVLNKRWVVRRGSNIDVESILRNVPGGVTMANDVEKDVREVNWADVTSSSFQEQDRLNADFDDLNGGGLSSSSVMTNRRLNETVGGMQMLSAGGNALTEYTLSVFRETWVEPTLRQLMLLEQHYENDMTVLAIAAQRAGAWQHFGMSPDLDALLKNELTLTVNVGMGATDPQARLQRFMGAMGAYASMSTTAPQDVDLQELRKELFGLAGFKDSNRFFTQVDPRLAQAQQMMQNAEGMAKQFIDQHKERIQRRERQLDNRGHDLDMREMALGQDFATQLRKLEQEFALKVQQQQVDLFHSGKKLSQDLFLGQVKAQNDANLAWFNAQVDSAIKHYNVQVQAAVQMKLANAKVAAGAD